MKLAPGEYRLGKNGADRTFSASRAPARRSISAAATLWVDSQDLKGFGGGHENAVNLVGLYGTNITLKGLNLDTRIVSGSQGWADMYANSVKLSGTNNTLTNATINTRGSTAYGYGDAFGKGPRLRTRTSRVGCRSSTITSTVASWSARPSTRRSTAELEYAHVWPRHLPAEGDRGDHSQR